MILGFVAVVNLFTKDTATKYGVAYTVFLVLLFTISEQIGKKRVAAEKKGLEQFNLEHQEEISSSLTARPGCVLVAVRDYHRMEHLKRVLEKTNLRRHDIVVMTVRTISTGAGEYNLSDEQLFANYEKELFSHVVELAEKEGKPVELLVVPALNPFDAMAKAANTLRASRLVTGVSARMDSDELARRIGLAWEALEEPRQAFSLEVISPDRPTTYVNLGPHPPRLWPEDVDLLHDLWLKMSGSRWGARMHHRDIVGLALWHDLQRDLAGSGCDEIVDELPADSRLAREIRKPGTQEPEEPV